MKQGLLAPAAHASRPRLLLAAIILRNTKYLDARLSKSAPPSAEDQCHMTPPRKSARLGAHWPMAADSSDGKDERLPLLIPVKQLLF